MWAACLAVGVTVVAAACQDGGPTTVTLPPPPPPVLPTEELTFLRQDASAPTLVTTDTTLVATAGEDFRLRIFYAPEGGSTEGEEFLELEWDDDSLLRYPPGHPMANQTFAPGDTITIQVSVDPAQLIATLEPSGIVFNPSDPAELELRYVNADDDYDEDGEDDPEDEPLVDMWRQENVGDPWTRVGEIKDADEDRVRARLTSFSRYALAF
jgi:hypothetical protein